MSSETTILPPEDIVMEKAAEEAAEEEATTKTTEPEGGGGEEDEDEDEDEEDEEEEETDDEVENFREEMFDALSDLDGQGLHGSFGYSKTGDAPNPGLQVGSLGTVGLPLSTREAKAIVSICEQAPFGMGERTVVDTEVRDTWQLDGSQVRFTNPSWNEYLNTTVKEVCTVLGVNFEVSRPRCELYKLLLYEAGSHFLPHVDTEKVDGMFATIIIVLPSHFTGGVVHLRHDGQEKMFVTGGEPSTLQTSVLAWYSDVSHEVKPVESGYRFALSFNLIHTTNALRHTAPIGDETLTALERIFKAWERQPDNAPEKLLHILSHKYSHANLRGNALKGEDAHLASRLLVLAEQFNFGIGLATLKTVVSGQADDYGGRSRYDPYAEEDAEEFEMCDIDEEYTLLENLVSLDGSLIRNTLSIHEEEEVTDEDWMETVRSTKPDKQYQGYQGNYGGTLEYFYRTTVLVLWPSYNNAYMTTSPERLQSACSRLESGQGNRIDVDLVLSASHSPSVKKPSALRALCSAASKWGDFDLWVQSLLKFDGSKSIALLGMSRIMDSLVAFGFPSVQPHIENMIQTESDAKEQLALINHVISRKLVPEDWIARQKLVILESLQPSSILAMADDIKSVLDLAVGNGGIAFCRDRVLPKLRTVDASSAYLVRLARALHDQRPFLCGPGPDITLIQGLVEEVLVDAINRLKLSAFKVSVVTPRFVNQWQGQTKFDTSLLVDLVRACCYTGCAERLASVVARIIEIASAETAPEIQAHLSDELMIPFISQLSPITAEQVPPLTDIAGLKALAQLAITFKISPMTRLPRPDQYGELIETVSLAGGATMLKKIVLPKLRELSKPWDAASWKSLILALYERRSKIAPGSDQSITIDTVVTECLIHQIEHSPLRVTATQPYRFGVPSSSTLVINQDLVDLLQLCYQTENPAAYPRVLDRVLKRKNLGSLSQQFSSILSPLLSSLLDFMKKVNIDIRTPPFSVALEIIVCTFVDHVLGPKPDDQAAQGLIQHCALLGTPEASRSLSIGAQKARHVAMKFGRLSEVQADVVHTSPRYSVTLRRGGVVLSYLQWDNKRTEAGAMLSRISSSEGQLKECLGQRLDLINQVFNGANVQVGAPSRTPAPAPDHHPTMVRRPADASGTALARPVRRPLVPTASGPLPRPVSPARKRRKVDAPGGEVIDLTWP